MREMLGLVGWLALTFMAGAIGAIASVDAAGFYAQLIRPAWAPPAAVFGPVWTTLYAMMGWSAWLVWRDRSSATIAIALFVLQLVVNALWSWLFFAWRLGAFAFADVMLLIVLIAATIFTFGRVRRAAALLLLPYLAWVSFAAVLTWTVWKNNPHLLG